MLNMIEEKLKNNEDVTLMFVGDSITYGRDHCTADETYCAVLAALFAARYPHTDVVRYDGLPTKNELAPLLRYDGPFVVSVAKGKRQGSLTFVRSGIGGNTVQRALNRVEDFCAPFVKGRSADVYFTMFGINDALACDVRKHVSPDRFYHDYKMLCDRLREASPDAEIVMLTPTYNDLGDNAESHLAPYCDRVKKLAAELGVKLIDTHSLWMEHLIVGSAHNGQRDWLSDHEDDHCHFSPEGSRKTAEFIFEQLKELDRRESIL